MQPPAGSQVSRVPAQRTPPEQLAPPAPAPAPERPRRRLRTVLAIVAGVVALLCGTGAVVGFVLYDRATAPDRSSPDVVVASYIQAFLVERDDTKAKQLTCEGTTDLNGLRALRDDLAAREKKFDTTISVSWGPLNVQQSGEDAVVEVDLVIAAFIDGISQSDRQGWRFETRRGDGWGVCKAQPAG
ncbi:MULTISPECIES: hypothetical protein [Micromonospora]|uniref:Mce-associated membrane protein n=1 Tax=Micromonospora solifontis TaxID=2487138 RepID=A0ABX9WGP9_9ACTN|nr:MULTISPECIES: hypothetical protein [Micromonospora]NES14713.1 hypothetical protein [Micromonospora sp. PPF5-17B]NES36694.1 hypothetical protein [Micromonospora solifontis]NES55721.1 hypothetical protein [Micromonospora sp. PPF5-6]RNL99156.1 hypothetical protein EFE23_11080 [Micromonospora solifontis]